MASEAMILIREKPASKETLIVTPKSELRNKDDAISATHITHVGESAKTVSDTRGCFHNECFNIQKEIIFFRYIFFFLSQLLRMYRHQY